MPQVKTCDKTLVGPVVALDSCGVHATLIDRDLLWQPLGANGLAPESLGRVPIPCGREEKINRVALFVHGAVEIGPLPLDFHIRLIKPPAPTYRTLAAAKLFFNLRGVL